VKIYSYIDKLFVQALATGRKVSLWWAFFPVSQRVRINYIFTDNIGTLYVMFILHLSLANWGPGGSMS